MIEAQRSSRFEYTLGHKRRAHGVFYCSFHFYPSLHLALLLHFPSFSRSRRKMTKQGELPPFSLKMKVCIITHTSRSICTMLLILVAADFFLWTSSVGQEVNMAEKWYDAEEDLESPGAAAVTQDRTLLTADASDGKRLVSCS